MRTREAALSALFTLISGAYAWKNKPSRRLKLWNDVAREQRPAFFQFEGDKQPYKWTNGAIAQRQLDQGLGVRPRVQHVRRHPQHDLPKPPPAQDVAQRLAMLAPAEVVLQRRGLVFGQRPVRLGDDVGAAGPRRPPPGSSG